MKKEEKKETVALKGTKVRVAALQTALHWPGKKLHCEKTLGPDKYPKLHMEMVPQGLLLDMEGDQCVVPYPNVANCVIE